MTTFSTLESPVGELLLVGDDDGLRGLYLPDHQRGPQPAPHWRCDDGALARTRDQLGEYFAGDRTGFDLALAPEGTPFQLEVWDALREIPYGETTSYGQLAAMVGRPGAARAVGAANGRNPISIVVPCHRVGGSAGALTGYAGGVAVKERLLVLEAMSALAAR
jgi:methylated-DNA-[protein]-cysteine S-methyltransferase